MKLPWHLTALHFANLHCRRRQPMAWDKRVDRWIASQFYVLLTVFQTTLQLIALWFIHNCCPYLRPLYLFSCRIIKFKLNFILQSCHAFVNKLDPGESSGIDIFFPGEIGIDICDSLIYQVQSEAPQFLPVLWLGPDLIFTVGHLMYAYVLWYWI